MRTTSIVECDYRGVRIAGRPIRSAGEVRIYLSGLPESRAGIANLGPGTQISLGYEVNLADGEIAFERWEVVVPDTFQPISWFDNET